jgi:pimeloyl-ACP methyl ester carboxylesterase
MNRSSRLASNVIVLLALVLVLAAIANAQTAASGPPREHFQNADVIYGWVQDSAGHRLRTFTTRPKNAAGKLPAIFFVGWLSCDSVEYSRGESDGFGAIFWRLIEQSGYATPRLDKAGVGESQGDCARLDFNNELLGYQVAFDEMLKYDFIDPEKVFVVGLSNGGGTSALIPRQHPVRGYIAASSWGRTWYEHMLELERVRLTGDGKTPGEVNSGIKAFTEFYDLPDSRDDAGRGGRAASGVEEFLVRCAGRAVRASSRLLSTVAGAESGRGLAEGDGARPGDAWNVGHHHERCRCAGDCGEREPRASRNGPVC